MGKSLKGKELGKGIQQRKDGTYQGRFTDRFGKRQTVYAKTYTEITQKLRRAQYEDEKALNVVSSNVTLSEWFETCLQTDKMDLRNSTIRTYRIQFNRIKPSLGDLKLTKLTKLNIQLAFNNLKTDKSRADCKALLVDLLNCAMRADLLTKNVAVNIKTELDHDEPKERRVLTDAEITTVKENACKTGTLYPFFILALNTGMRMGEVLGLTWDCVDFDKNIIHVRNTLCYLPNDGNKGIYELHKPKTEAGKRDIPMTKECKDMFLYLQERKAKIDKRHTPLSGFEDLVLPSKTNQPINEANVRRSILYLVDNLKTKGIYLQEFTPHEIRHTFATTCVYRGVTPKTLQRWLGHKSLKMTMDLYCHVPDDKSVEEMALFGAMPE